MVHMYPFAFHRDRLFAVLASQRTELSVHELVHGTSKSDNQHAAEWQGVVSYLGSLTLSKLRVHCPLLSYISALQATT